MQALTDNIYVSAQIGADDIEAIQKQGITQIICNRPDNEAIEQPSAEEISKLATHAGIHFTYAPVTSGNSPEDILPQTKLILDKKEKTLMYCKSGTRSTIVWALIEAAKGRDVDQLINQAAQAGYGIGQLKEFIQAYAEKQA